MLNEIIKLLGVELFEHFTLVRTERAKILGYKDYSNRVFRFDTQLVHQVGDNWSGYETDEIFYGLVLGLYEIKKLNPKDFKDL